jgi:hypothetical protein
LPSSISDHEAGVSFSIRAINASSKGSGYWKLNASLLKRPGYKKLIESIINDFAMLETHILMSNPGGKA